ncbi:MAG TPA: phospholipase D-like domain-containing protein [Nocardioides sp.]|uniref:phospholipase D-like domain-containing protein n=1 Tax=uncultured Nocardioides sp. TaxID=198441 RepID=UPI00261CAC00|nr:phospholipase D-like domain-containing protein [uncultured Nocardioides sp.]HRD61263.1 phospholipase D-like domain-containing protein [Nocardioides sp.]HRI98473.1 phospholipase D-like domain-containing protein [Nocardioides sp.]
MKRLSTLGSCAVSIALVLTMWNMAPTAQASVSAAQGTAPAQAATSAGVAQVAAEKKPKRWKAYQGAFFNNPHIPSQRYRIERRLLDTLRHVPKGETVRIALYSFDRIPVANAIVAAHKRGVRIQMLLNDHWENRAMQIVRAALGTNTRAKNFIYKCKSGCRTLVDQYRNLHSKFYLFPKAGKSERVIALGSHNFTMNADRHQWNDIFFFQAKKDLYREFVKTFNDMKKDYSKTQPSLHFCGTPTGSFCDDSVDKYTNWVFPKKSTPQSDLVLNMLNKIQCLTPDGAGGQTRTKLALSMHTMRGARGNYLAAAIRQKWAEGCDFRVSYGLIGFRTKQILGAATARGRIPLRSTGLDYDPDDDFDLNNDGDDDVILTYYTHQKYFVIQGTYNGHPGTSMVLTGSSNWASLGTAQDEIFFTILGAGNARRYLKNFNTFWNSGRFSRNAYTTTYTDFRVPTTVRAADGTTQTVWKTVRRPVTTVEPDPYQGGGEYWEGD